MARPPQQVRRPHDWQVFQPADRFWLFQGIETGIYIALAAILLYLAFRRIRVMA